MATKKKTTKELYDEVIEKATSKTVTLASPELTTDDQIDALEEERTAIEQEYNKKLRAIDKKIKELKDKLAMEESAKALKNMRDAFIAGGMSEAAAEEMVMATFKKQVISRI